MSSSMRNSMKECGEICGEDSAEQLEFLKDSKTAESFVRMQDSQMIAEQQAEDMLMCIMEEL